MYCIPAFLLERTFIQSHVLTYVKRFLASIKIKTIIMLQGKQRHFVPEVKSENKDIIKGFKQKLLLLIINTTVERDKNSCLCF
jgi:hypothetical protein